MKKIIINSGDKFGRLTAIRKSHQDKYGHVFWLCKCDCGNETFAKPSSLKSGHKTSCGCLQKETLSNLNKTHGYSVSSGVDKNIYQIWKGMKARCYNQNNQMYHLYGGRGIGICHEWINDAKAFHDWALSNGYTRGLSIERIDVNSDYNPQNCKWIPVSKQNLNKRNSIYLEIGGKQKLLVDVAREYNISYHTLYSRLKKGLQLKNILLKNKRICRIR